MYIDKEFYTAHINDRDKLVEMRRVLDKIEMVLNRHTVERTDFLDPYEIRLAKSILNRFSEIGYLVDGGFKDAERKVITIYPDYYQDEINPEIRALRANVGEDSVSHKDYLGAILNLGIDRSKLGDILIHEDFGYILVKEEISKFILYNLERIKNMKVKLENVPLSEITVPKAKYKEISRQIASPRLDSVISAGLNISRSKSASLIKANRVKVNWEPVNKTSEELTEGDLLSVKGFGRFIFYKVTGFTKKGRTKCLIRIII